MTLSACTPKLVYPPRDQATLQACTKDCTEQWKSCQGKGCDEDRAKCAQRCRDYGGLRGNGSVTIQIP